MFEIYKPLFDFAITLGQLPKPIVLRWQMNSHVDILCTVLDVPRLVLYVDTATLQALEFTARLSLIDTSGQNNPTIVDGPVSLMYVAMSDPYLNFQHHTFGGYLTSYVLAALPEIVLSEAQND